MLARSQDSAAGGGIELDSTRRVITVICTHHYDKYTRHLADVFYLPDSTYPQAIYAQGIYLNQQLIDKRKVERVVP